MLLDIPALAGREQVTHVIRGDRAAICEQVLCWKQTEDTHQATSMIRMHMRQCYEVKVAHVVLPEKRRHQLHTSVEAPVIRAAPIDEERMIPRPLDDHGVPCTNIQKRHAELLRTCL